MTIEQQDFYTQTILSLAALVGLTSFLMLGQGRLLRLIFVFAVQGLLLTLTTALAAYSLNNPHLYISAVLNLVLKVIFIPWMLRREVIQMNTHRDIEALNNNTMVMLGGASLMVFSYYVLHPIVQTTSPVMLNALALSLSVVLLGMLLMISHRQAVAHVVGFMSIENGLFFAAIVATKGMPMVVELGVAFDVLVAAVLFGIFFFHIRTSIDSLDVDLLNKLHEVDK
ncbi:Hydrogenase-4 component E [Candidatus Methylobacter favarea]|uniref:Hydrogenase-4 component E n=1 Tax=Candidatus Methylobacter favarea TaxID=2707345 RepID=A0A8S0Y644_9GAMM|nr:formate hydrogenlyase [Candidatus Methylobacter favarea]CAA9890463.1 Hydrogenase-4 component E [Candidatus Methylobacter favarea]